MSNKAIHPFETMIVVISRLIKDGEVAATGTLSPIPAAALYLAQLTHAPNLVPLVYGDPDLRITDGLLEFFGLTQRGLIDLIFLSGMQIDQHGNFNLSVIGDFEKPKIRLPGGAGSNMMNMMAKRTIFFTLTHTTRLFVPEVDFINGSPSDKSIPWRRGVLSNVVTPISLLKYNEEKEAIILDSTYPDISLHEVEKNTGFDLGIEGRTIPQINQITEEELGFVRGEVLDKTRKVYPLFCDMVWGGA